MKLATIIGARPQFIKAALVSQQMQKHNTVTRKPVNSLTEIIIHTGQHYDYEMSQIFFDQLDIPKPDYNLGVGSGTHANQTGIMLIKIEEVLLKEQPDLVLVYGDTNSTLAGALAAAKLNIPVAHIEAGMRSFNREMPEEINRVLTDHISNLLFCSTQTAVDNLKNEGFSNIINDGKLIDSSFTLSPLVVNVGDVMYDICLKSIKIAENHSNILTRFNLEPKKYYLVTVHRQSNTDNVQNLRNILEAFSELDLPVIFPIHPRTKKAISYVNTQPVNPLTHKHDNIIFTEPVNYFDMLVLEKNANKILTDSGGVQKEAYFYGVPCITLREKTEWVETVEAGWNILTGASKKRIVEAVQRPFNGKPNGSLYGDGKASEKICQVLANFATPNTS